MQEIERLKHPKNSHNSSVPPSKYEHRPLKTKSLRSSDGKSPGGQTEHEGNTLMMVENPNHIIEHKPAICNHCGKDLSNASTELSKNRAMRNCPLERKELR